MFIFRPSSIVHRKPPLGIPQGAEPLWQAGRDSQGDRPCTGPLERISLVTFFVRAKKVTRRRRRESAAKSRHKRRIRRNPGITPAAAGPHSAGEGPSQGRACYPTLGRLRFPSSVSRLRRLPPSPGGRLPATAGTKDGNRTKDISLLRERPTFAARRK